MTTTATAPKLYELAARHRQIFDAISAADGELTPELEAALDESSDSLAAKLEACCIRRLSLIVAASGVQGEIAAVQAELDRVKERKADIEREQAKLEAYMQRCVESSGEDRVDTGRFTVRVKENPPSAKWTGERDAIPYTFQRVTTNVEFDKAGALKAFKALEEGERLHEGIVISRTKKLVIK